MRVKESDRFSSSALQYISLKINFRAKIDRNWSKINTFLCKIKIPFVFALQRKSLFCKGKCLNWNVHLLQTDSSQRLINIFSIGWTFFLSSVMPKSRLPHSKQVYRRTGSLELQMCHRMYATILVWSCFKYRTSSLKSKGLPRAQSFTSVSRNMSLAQD